ncbi:3-alpha domain-containing protein [Streptomyces nigra]|uniref:3-alpha domain-containing protein n=1 Tax=Streptomyces nigra TaxID=1827580 RepID=UPI0036A801DF
MPALLVAHHRPGFYMRVIREGRIQAGDPVVRTRTGPGALSVADVDALLYLPGRDPALLRRALAVPALSPGWQGSFRDLLAEAEGGEPGGGAPAWDGFRSLRVSDVVAETDTVVSLHLTSADGTPLPDARAGQYLTVRVPGAGPSAPIRSYSLSAVPGSGRYRISVKREPHGTASAYLTTALRPGAVLDVAAPRGDFVLDGGTGPVLLVSAGIGVTPVLAMLHELAARTPEREVWWLHGARGPREHPLGGEAHAVLGSLPHAHEHVYYSAATPEERRRAHASPGRLTPDAVRALGVPAEASAYVCGPDSFMTDMRQALTEAGVDPARVHTELFATLPSLTPGLTGTTAPVPHPPPGPPGTGPRVTFARSGVTAPFPDGARSLLDLADACDVPARWACRTGVCHTCVTPVLSGDVGYAPAPLEPPPAGQALICCSRPRTDVVLDM